MSARAGRRNWPFMRSPLLDLPQALQSIYRSWQSIIGMVVVPHLIGMSGQWATAPRPTFFPPGIPKSTRKKVNLRTATA